MESPPADGSLSATAVMLFLRGSLRANPDATPGTFRLQLENRVWTLIRREGAVEIEPGDVADADAGIRTTPIALNGLLLDSDGLDAALATGAAEIEGDVNTLRRLLAAVTSAGS